MTHYVCPGECGSSSDQPGQSCANENCLYNGKVFATCDCEDGMHKSVKARAKVEEVDGRIQ